MGGLWGAGRVPCAAAGFETKAETPKSCHGEWRSSEQRSGSEALRDIKRGWRSEKIINSPNPSLGIMSQTPFSPTITAPLSNNDMDIDSDPEAEQAAMELAQAQERVRAAQEAWEKCWEEQRRQEEERKVQIVAAFKLAVEQAAEVAVDREQRILLQVSLSSSLAF